jgi:hypothetical protein
MKDYIKQAQDFLDKHSITFKSILIGPDCPPFCEDRKAGRDMDLINTFPRRSHIHGKHYLCTFTHPDRPPLVLDFWNSYADEEHNYVVGHPWEFKTKPAPVSFRKAAKPKRKTPTAYDVLAGVTKYDPGRFEDFCADFGYDTDSREAERTYHAVCDEYRKVRSFFTSDEMTELEDIQ